MKNVFAKMKIFSVAFVALSLCVGILQFQNVQAQEALPGTVQGELEGDTAAAPAERACATENQAIRVYGQKICPDQSNVRDNFVRWNEMIQHFDEILPGAYQAEPQPAELVCEHVKRLLDKYTASSEIYAFKLQSVIGAGAKKNEKLDAFLEPYRADAEAFDEGSPDDLVILKILNSKDPKAVEELLSFYTEKDRIKIQLMKGFIDNAGHVATLYDSALDTCPEYAAANRYYKIVDYNGPDADYDASEDDGWEALRKKWEENEKAGIVE